MIILQKVILYTPESESGALALKNLMLHFCRNWEGRPTTGNFTTQYKTVCTANDINW